MSGAECDQKVADEHCSIGAGVISVVPYVVLHVDCLESPCAEVMWTPPRSSDHDVLAHEACAFAADLPP